MNNDVLKPCPFCGNKDVTLHKSGQDLFFYAVLCQSGCRCSSAYCESEDAAISRWNRRAAGKYDEAHHKAHDEAHDPHFAMDDSLSGPTLPQAV